MKVQTLAVLLPSLAPGCADDLGPPPVSQPAHASADVGPEGGRIDNGDASVDIPTGALDETVHITVATAEPPSPLPGGFWKQSPITELTPHGQAFSKPITITLDYESGLSSSHQVLRLDDASDTDWEIVSDVTFEDAQARFESAQFSYVTVGTTDHDTGTATATWCTSTTQPGCGTCTTTTRTDGPCG